MTDHDVSADVEAVVEDTQLPSRLKERVYRTIVDREEAVTVEQADEIARAVEHRYMETRVDPLDPVGTVSAQSIGEPGTQMSIPGDERVVVRHNGATAVTEIGPLVDDLLGRNETRTLDDHEVALAPEGLEVLSLRSDETVEWKPIEEVSRHRSPNELLRFDLKSGRSIRATKAHSFVTRRDNEVVPVAGDDLEVGDWLPVVGSFGVDEKTTQVDLRDYLSAGKYRFTSTLTDGGVSTSTQPGGPDQLRNKRQALDAGDLDENTAYPHRGTVSLPERFPLDEETGFFIGAFLAEGHATDHYVSVSNVDPDFQSRIRAFAERFELTVNEYDNESGFTTGHETRVNETVLVDFLRAICYEDAEKKVPEFAFGATDEFVEGLLAGYFSGDGNVRPRSIRSSSTDERLSEGIAFLLSRVGLYATRGETDGSHTLRVPGKYVARFHEQVGMVGERGDRLAELAANLDPAGPDATDQIPNFGDVLAETASEAGIPSQRTNTPTKRQRIGRTRLERFIEEIERETVGRPEGVNTLEQAVESDVVWDRIESIERVASNDEYVYDVSVEGLETFTTAQGVVTHNTMNTFHYAGVAEIDVTQGLPRLIELVDARKTPDTPMMTVHLEEEYATSREKAHEVVWEIESTRILALGDISTNVADMEVRLDLNEQTLRERWPKIRDGHEVIETDAEQLDRAVSDVVEGVQSNLKNVGSDGVENLRAEGTVVRFEPGRTSYRDLLQLVEELRDVVFKGIEDVTRVVIRKEEASENTPFDADEEFVLYTEGSALKQVLDIDGVDASRTTSNNIHEVHENLGVEAARNAIINETMETLEEQGLDDVNIRHLMLVADIMTNRGTIESIGRHGISGSKESVLARAAFEVTVNHLLDAAVHGEIDDLNGVTENVIVGKPIKLGTGDVDLRMGSFTGPGGRSDAD